MSQGKVMFLSGQAAKAARLPMRRRCASLQAFKGRLSLQVEGVCLCAFAPPKPRRDCACRSAIHVGSVSASVL